MSSSITIIRSPPTSPAVSTASFKSIKTSTRMPRRRVVKTEAAVERSSPSMQSWFTKVVRSSAPPSSGDAPGPLEQFLVVVLAVVSSHGEGELWQQRVYWCLLILAAASFLSVCLFPPGTPTQGGFTGMICRIPRHVFDFIMLRWPSIVATSLAYRGLVLVAFPMSLGYLLSLVFCCYRFTMYLVYVITYLSFTFPLSTLLLLPLTILVGPTYLKWTVLFVGWSIVIYIAISALIGMYTANTITQIRVPSFLAWRLDHFGKRSHRKKSSSKQHPPEQEPRHSRLRPAAERTPEPSPEFSTPPSVARTSVVSLKSEVKPIILHKEGRDRIVSLASQSTVASMGRTGSGSSFMNDGSPSAGSSS